MDIINDQYCPICETPEENKGSMNIKMCTKCADAIVAQLVERELAKFEAVGAEPIYRSK